MCKMAYYAEFGMYMYIWGHSSPVVNCTFSKCGVWEGSHVGRTEKESKHLVHCHTHFLTCQLTHHIHILSYRFLNACYRFGRLRVTIVFELYLKNAQNYMYALKTDCGVCLSPWLTSCRSHPPPNQESNISNSRGVGWYIEHSYRPYSFWVTRDGEEEERRRWTKLIFSSSIFSTLRNISGTLETFLQ